MPVGALALDPDKTVSQYNFHSWTRANGLPMSGVNAIAQTSDGYIWLGTSGGLVRFDGAEFKLVGMLASRELHSTIVRCLAADQDGGLWFGLEQSSYGHYDGRGAWLLGREDGGSLNWKVHTLVVTARGRLFVGGSGLSGWRTGDGTVTPIFDSRSDEDPINVTAAFEDSRGRMWIGTSNGGLYYRRGGELVKVSDSSPDGPIFLAGAEDDYGQIWFGTHTGLVCYDTQLRRKQIPFPNNEVTALLADRQGSIWIGTAHSGIARWSRAGFSFLRKSDGLAGDSVLALAEDREGSIWIGSREGLTQLTDVKFPTLSEREGIPGGVAQSVSASPRGGLWVATGKGITYLHHGGTTYSTESGLHHSYAKRVFEASNGDVFVLSGRNEIEVLSAGQVVARHETSAMPVAMTEDADGVVVSVAGDLYRVDREQCQPYRFAGGEEPPLYWVLNLITSRDGAIWVACVNGICRVKDGEFQHWATAERRADYEVRWLCEDPDGIIWAGTPEGIVRLKGNRLTTISEQNGLFDGNVYAIVPDDAGNLWVDSIRGLYRVSRNSLNDVAAGSTNYAACVSYDSPDAVKPTDKQGLENSGCKTLDGRIWFPSQNGVIMINPARIPTNAVAPPVFVDSVRANGRELRLDRDIVLPPGEPRLEFRFVALSYVQRQDLRIRYRLEGFDSDWVEAKDWHTVYYKQLRPGRYRFRVIASNADNVWNYTGDSVDLQLLPHYYQTTKFHVANGVFALAGLTGLYGWRRKALRRRERTLAEARDVLERRVSERTAELVKASAAALDEVRRRERAQEEVECQKARLEQEIEERKRIEVAVERANRQLVEASRQAGMAEVATGVLHNVGNVLNSVNVTATLISDQVKKSFGTDLARVVALLEEHKANLGEFLTADSRGSKIPAFLGQIASAMNAQRGAQLQELELLRKNIEHIKDIITMQQSYAKVSGLVEPVNLRDLAEDALRMNASALARHDVDVCREYVPVPDVTTEKHKVLQILVNLIRNAKYACDDAGRADKRLVMRISARGDRLRVSVIDNGVGIPAENLTKIFHHGFTTRKYGHGFGLHSGALAARELGGTLIARSGGPGRGATFTLELPIRHPKTGV